VHRLARVVAGERGLLEADVDPADSVGDLSEAGEVDRDVVLDRQVGQLSAPNGANVPGRHWPAGSVVVADNLTATALLSTGIAFPVADEG